MNKQDKQILNFIHQAEPLKTLLRHSWLSSGRRESVAEHTWRMALMAMLIYTHLDKKVKLEKVLKMVLVHDLVEIYAGDTWAFQKKNDSEAQKKEVKALKKLTKGLHLKLKKEIANLSREYMDAKTPEAKFAKALDKLEVLIQHNQSNIKTQNKKEIKFNLVHGDKYCEYDTFLKDFRELVRKETLKYYRRNRVDKKLYK